MGLLTNLGLTPTPNVAKAIAAKAIGDAAVTKPQGDRPTPPATPANATTAVATTAASAPKANGAIGSGGGDDGGARKTALALKAEIERRHKAAYDQWNKLSEAEPKVAQLIAAATGPQKAALEAKKELLDKKIAELGKETEELRGDIEALDNPGTDRAKYVQIAQRNKGGVAIAGLSEIDLHEEDLSKKRGEKRETRTTTSYENGKSTVDKTEKTRTYGLDGVTVGKSRETETSLGGNTVKTGEESKTKVSLTGKVSHDEQKSIEIETADGKKMKVEKSTSTEISAEGVSGTRSDKTEHRDGSSSETTRTGGVERGEGKVGAVAGKSTTTTDVSGDAVTKGGKGKAGMIAKDGAMGGFAEGEGSVKSQRKGGFSTGLVGNLGANITCKIGDPQGKPPKVQYPLTLEVSFDVSLGASVGQDKKGAAAKASVDVKASKSASMKRTYLLSEAEAADYVASLQAAAKGGKVAATHKEFAVISLGARQGWGEAKKLFLGTGDSSASLKVGESKERKGGKSLSAKVSGDAKVITAEASIEESDEHSETTSRDEDGNIVAELSASQTEKMSGKVGIKSGVVGGSAGKAHAFTTSSGYSIKIDPKKDPGGVRQKALDACSDQKAYDDFAAMYPETVESATKGKDESDSNSVGVAIGAVDAEIGLHSGIKQKTKTGKGGKLESREVTGSSGGGGSVGVGKTRIGDSVDDEAHAVLDGEGNASLDLSKTVKATSLKKLAKAKLPFFGDKKEEDGKGKRGLLATAAGDKDEEDTEVVDKTGLSLTNKDLDAIAKIATSKPRRWEQAAVMDYNASHDDWEKARKVIVAAGGDRQVVADQLASFIGGSKSKRLDMVERFLRPDGDVSIGARTAFPESLKALKPDYDKLVLGAAEELIEAVAKKDGPAKAGEFGKQTFDALEKLNQAITGAKEALAPAVRAEMLSALSARKTKVLAVMRKNAGNQSAQEDKAAMEAEYRRMTKGCLEYQFAQDDLFANVKEWWAPGRTYNNDKLIRALQQLRDLYAVWKPDYAKCAALGKQIGYPEGNYNRYAPAYSKFDEWEKKIHQY